MKEQSKPIDAAVGYLREMIDADCILSFGSRIRHSFTTSAFTDEAEEEQKSIHYDLLAIIPDSEGEKADYIGRLEEFKDLFFTVNLLVRTNSAVQKELDANSRFFHTVLEKGELVYSKTGALPTGLTGQFDAKANYEAAAEYWDDILESTDETIGMCYNCTNPRIEIPLLHGCLKQICEGLIFLMLGLRTEGYTLTQLLSLCDSIDTRFRDLLPIVNDGDRYHYGLLMAGEWIGQFGRDREPISAFVEKQCDDFRDLAKEVCELELERRELALLQA